MIYHPKTSKKRGAMTKCHALRRGHGRDEELDLHANAALEACEATVQEYCDLAPDGDEVSSFKVPILEG